MATIAAGAGLGASPTVALSNATDEQGTATLTSGASGTGTGALAVVTLGSAYSSAVDGGATFRPFLSWDGAGAEGLGLYVTTIGAMAFTIACTNAPATGTAYVVFYRIELF